MAQFTGRRETSAVAEARRKRYAGKTCCHVCGGYPCSCGAEMYWNPKAESWAAFWKRCEATLMKRR